MKPKIRILICGILPPPHFGHSMVYHALMQSPFVDSFEVIFFNIRFWSYQSHRRVTFIKILKFVRYYLQFVGLLIWRRPRYVIYGISFDKMPFVKDAVFCLTGRLLGARVVLHDMGQYLRAMYDQSSLPMQKFIRFFMLRMSASIVLGEKTRSVYAGFMEPDRVFSVPAAVADSVGIEAQREKDPAHLRILYFSFVSVSKGIWNILQAMEKIVSRNHSVCLTVAGPFETPQLEAELREFVRQKGLGPHVNFTGYVGSDQERTRYFRNADVFVFPTRRDVFGLVLLHAMAEKLPIVATYEGCIPEIVVEGKGGFLFPVGDVERLAEKILVLANDERLRRQCGEYNRRRYEDFYTIAAYGQRMISVFETLEKTSSF